MNENNIQTSKNRERKRRKFNLIDFLLILIILAAIAALVYVFLPFSAIKNITSDTSRNIQYVIEIQGVDEEFLENISENNIVLDSVSKSNIGTVIAVDYSTQHTRFELQENDDGNIGVLSPVTGKYNVIVTISANAYFSEGNGYTVNGTRIAVGEKINARFPSYVCESYCISVPKD